MSASSWIRLYGELIGCVAVGLVYKKGKFSAIEEAQLKEAIENFRIVSQQSFSRFVIVLIIFDI